MNTLKLVRAIAVETAVLAGILSVIVFFISTLYWSAIDAIIKRDEAYTEAVKKIHQTTFNQAAVLMILCILGTLSLVFL